MLTAQASMTIGNPATKAAQIPSSLVYQRTSATDMRNGTQRLQGRLASSRIRWWIFLFAALRACYSPFPTITVCGTS